MQGTKTFAWYFRESAKESGKEYCQAYPLLQRSPHRTQTFVLEVGVDKSPNDRSRISLGVLDRLLIFVEFVNFPSLNLLGVRLSFARDALIIYSFFAGSSPCRRRPKHCTAIGALLLFASLRFETCLFVL